jgi:amino acid transporter
MELKRLVTLSFDRNVGTADRIFRLVSGAGLAAAGWFFTLPTLASAGLSVLGIMWFATGVLSKCSIYYLLGYSSCPVSGESFSRKAR